MGDLLCGPDWPGLQATVTYGQRAPFPPIHLPVTMDIYRVLESKLRPHIYLLVRAHQWLQGLPRAGLERCPETSSVSLDTNVPRRRSRFSSRAGHSRAGMRGHQDWRQLQLPSAHSRTPGTSTPVTQPHGFSPQKPAQEATHVTSPPLPHPPRQHDRPVHLVWLSPSRP